MCYNRSIKISKKKQEENSLNKTKQKIKRKIIVTKVKFHQKRVEKKVLVVPNHPIFLIKTSAQDENKKNNHAKNKTTDKEKIGSHGKEKTTGSKKYAKNTAKNRPNDQHKSRKSVVVSGDSTTKQLNGWEYQRESSQIVKFMSRHFREQQLHAWRII